MEILNAETGKWRQIAALAAGETPGSVSNNSPTGRDVIQFTCNGHFSLIERSMGGVDSEHGDLRMTASVGFEPVARLEDGQDYEFDLQTDRMPAPARCRFRHKGRR